MLLNLNEGPKYGKRPRVLVVDDDAFIRQGLFFLLDSEFDVTTVESGDKATEQISENGFDVVSLDLKMFGMTGIDTLKVIKEWNPNTEVLIVSAYSDFDAAKEALKAGAYDYINKPFDKEEFLAAIRKGVDRRFKAKTPTDADEQPVFVKAQLRESEKRAALGQLVVDVVNDLSKPLEEIIHLSCLLLKKKRPSQEWLGYLEKINKDAHLCRGITEKFLPFSKKQNNERKYVQINDIIDSAIGLTKDELEADGIELIKHLAKNMPDMAADFYELQKVLLNMIYNAHQAMEEHSGKKSLTVKSEFDDKTIRVSFQDTGPGIPTVHLQKIFEPLFTTKENGKGTGLGLSVCYEIIKQYNGNIYVTSEQGNGAHFVIDLPILGRAS